MMKCTALEQKLGVQEPLLVAAYVITTFLMIVDCIWCSFFCGTSNLQDFHFPWCSPLLAFWQHVRAQGQSVSHVRWTVCQSVLSIMFFPLYQYYHLA
mmetsp:Transcript_154/g.224  ORF Transcript_154/g.224 Transcript_154/m.224 type:complete len:97 (-) Transcript_154:1050-1340(-)